MTLSELCQFLVHWHTDLEQELQTNDKQYLSCCHPSLTWLTNNSFPKLKILQAYVDPIVSPLPLAANHTVHSLRYCAVEVQWLATLWDLYLLVHALTEMFRRVIWPRVVTRLLLMDRSAVRNYANDYSRVLRILIGLGPLDLS